MHKRNPYLDIVKGITIISVILGHSIQSGNGVEYLDNGSFFDNIVFQFIYSFHSTAGQSRCVVASSNKIYR